MIHLHAVGLAAKRQRSRLFQHILTPFPSSIPPKSADNENPSKYLPCRKTTPKSQILVAKKTPTSISQQSSQYESSNPHSPRRVFNPDRKTTEMNQTHRRRRITYLHFRRSGVKSFSRMYSFPASPVGALFICHKLEVGVTPARLSPFINLNRFLHTD